MFGFGFGLAATRILIASFQCESQCARASHAPGRRRQDRGAESLSSARSVGQGACAGVPRTGACEILWRVGRVTPCAPFQIGEGRPAALRRTLLKQRRLTVVWAIDPN